MKTYYLHSKTARGNRFTLAARPTGGHILIGIAKCSKRDHFNKKIGRMISEGRLNKGVVYVRDGELPKVLREFAKEFSEIN